MDNNNINEIYNKLQSSLSICEEDIKKIIKESIEEIQSKKPKNIIPPWDDSNIVNNCYVCFNNFNFFNRKHHCRACGNIVCNKCSTNKKPVPIYGYYDPVRICDKCNIKNILERSDI